MATTAIVVSNGSPTPYPTSDPMPTTTRTYTPLKAAASTP